MGSLVILYRRQDSQLPVGVHAAVGWQSLTGGSRVTVGTKRPMGGLRPYTVVCDLGLALKEWTRDWEPLQG